MNDVISALTITETGIEHDNIVCPKCNNTLKPYGLGEKTSNKIQLFRRCRSCGELFWYWININEALLPFSEN